MRSHHHCIVLAGFLTVWTAIAGIGLAQPSSDIPYTPGETLTYDVSWSVFPAGQVTATLTKTREGGRDELLALTTARSQGFVSLLFTVQDEFRSFFDPDSNCSRRISKKINEGRRHKETAIVFDSQRRLAVLDERDLTKPRDPPKHAENDIPPCVQDVVSAFYFLRRQPLEVGRQVHIPINDGAKTYDVVVEVQAREKVQTPLGTLDAFRVEPRVFGGLYKRKGRMLIWLSDDKQRLPLRIKAMISVGSITGTLRSTSNSPHNMSVSK